LGAVVTAQADLGGRKRLIPIAGNLAMCHIVHMDRDQIIAKLREHAQELQAAGVVHLFLHGSYARGTEIRGSSDVDVIAEFDPRRRLSLVNMVAIENRLTDLLGIRVDLSPDKTLKEPVRDKAKREAVLAF
jgi:predicted nucleotidyltransferase